MKYIEGQTWKKDGTEYHIRAAQDWKVCYYNPCRGLRFSENEGLLDLGVLTHDADGNPVEDKPDPPEDKLYPVVADEFGAVVFIPIREHAIVVGQLIGEPDGEGHICIGFRYSGDRDESIWAQAVRYADGDRPTFPVHAVFRHHSLINQGSDGHE